MGTTSGGTCRTIKYFSLGNADHKSPLWAVGLTEFRIVKALFRIVKALFRIVKALFRIVKALFRIVKALFCVGLALFSVGLAQLCGALKSILV